MTTKNQPSLSSSNLPDDAVTLKQMVVHLLSDMHAKDRELLDVKTQLEWLRRQVFGGKSERLDPNQLILFDSLAEQIAAPKGSTPPDDRPVRKSGTSRRNGRKPLPKDLPREQINLCPPKEKLVCECCGRSKERIGEEITEELDYVPASFVVRQYVRGKYACKDCQEGVVIADLPPRPIEKGRPGSGLLAHVLTSKYADHLPLHRQEQIFKRHGIDVSRKTMCDWVRDSAHLLSPIVGEVKRQLLTSKKLHTDDTPVPVQDKNKTQTRTGYLWAYIDDRHHVVFDYTPNHSRDGPIMFLGDYCGYVQADAYKGYDSLFARGRATEVACWAHTRRRFYDARSTDTLRAHEMLALIGQLYDVERQAKDRSLDADAIRALRQEQSKPLLDKIEEKLNPWSIDVLPKSPIGQAVRYARQQWDALIRYIHDGDLHIDNNLAERTLRTVAIGRKNWLFAGSDQGGHRAAVIYSLVASCKLCEVDPFEYLRDILDRVSTHPARKITDLTPPAWKTTRQPTTN